MKALLRLLASLKLSVGLLVALLVALAAGTIVESSQGTDTAQQLVYYSPWFRVLLAALGVNTLAALIDRWPPTKHRVGFYLTHSALLIILVGALTSELTTTAGSLALWEGQQSPTFVERGTGEEHRLPYTVRLDSFEIDTYQGTQRPAMFRSRVTVIDPEAGGGFRAVIEMNKELSYRGFDLFQSSYQISGGREMSILSVSHDPGQPIVFFGYFLLMGGMAWVIGTRMVQARKRRTLELGRREARDGERGGKASRAAALALPLLLLAGSLPVAAQSFSAPLPDPGTVEALRSLPVQHDGRVMPLDTLAREAVWNVTGDHDEFWGADPVALVLAWTFDSAAWQREPVVEIGDAGLASAAGLPAGTTHASFQQLAGSDALLGLMRDGRAKRQAEEPIPPQEEAALELEQRLLWMRSFLTREAIASVPPPGDPTGRWSPIPPTVTSADDLVAWYERQQTDPPEAWPAFAEMQQEITYNDARSTRLAWWILLPATLISLASLWKQRRWLDVLAVVGLVAGFAVMTWGIAMRWGVAGRIPASDMYESMLFLGWGIGLFAVIAAAVLRNRLVVFNAAAMAALTMMLVDLLPMDPFIHPMAPVLSGTPWLAIHVPIIMVSYSVLALGVLIAHIQIGIEIFKPSKREAAVHMNGLLYWYMHVGSLLLVAGIITGSIWAASSWGRYWGWDPKEVWSLIAFLAYMAILHSRFDRQIGAFGVAALSIVAFWTVLMTYLGVNFVLSAGLHSYGFGSGGLVGWMSGIGVLEIVYLAAGYAAHRRNRQKYGPLLAAGA